MRDEKTTTDRRLTPVGSESDAQAIASLWALEHHVPGAWYIDFSHQWFRNTPSENRVVTHLLSNLRGFSHARDESKATWNTYLAETQRLQCEWAIETVKHLAIINGAGIAGAVALLSGASHPLALKAAILLFGLGLSLAVFNLWLNNVGYARRAVDARGRLLKVQEASTWQGYQAAVTIPQGKNPGGRWFSASIIVGWASAGVAVIGLALIGGAFAAA